MPRPMAARRTSVDERMMVSRPGMLPRCNRARSPDSGYSLALPGELPPFIVVTLHKHLTGAHFCVQNIQQGPWSILR